MLSANGLQGISAIEVPGLMSMKLMYVSVEMNLNEVNFAKHGITKKYHKMKCISY